MYLHIGSECLAKLLIAGQESPAAMTTSLEPQSVFSLAASIIAFTTALLGWLKSRNERQQAKLQALAATLALPPAKPEQRERLPPKSKPAKKKSAKKSRR